MFKIPNWYLGEGNQRSNIQSMGVGQCVPPWQLKGGLGQPRIAQPPPTSGAAGPDSDTMGTWDIARSPGQNCRRHFVADGDGVPQSAPVHRGGRGVETSGHAAIRLVGNCFPEVASKLLAPIGDGDRRLPADGPTPIIQRVHFQLIHLVDYISNHDASFST